LGTKRAQIAGKKRRSSERLFFVDKSTV